MTSKHTPPVRADRYSAAEQRLVADSVRAWRFRHGISQPAVAVRAFGDRYSSRASAAAAMSALERTRRAPDHVVAAVLRMLGEEDPPSFRLSPEPKAGPSPAPPSFEARIFAALGVPEAPEGLGREWQLGYLEGLLAGRAG